jgi:hypothetical protein
MLSVRRILIAALLVATCGVPCVVRADVVAGRVASNSYAVGPNRHALAQGRQRVCGLAAKYRCNSLLCPNFLLLGVGF